MESPIEIINNTHIEVTRILKIQGEYYYAKCYFFIVDISGIEASHYNGLIKCSKIWLSDGTIIKVKERYKHLKETHVIWQKWVQTKDLDQPV